ncbi:ParA family protein [Mucilaginibacter sp. L3T2-6]|uniref:ParA family protein n=1 Tax=Mucilaginibacter sp. L3T2-6 TaxID=3062491 RepID=UPI002674E0DC|nr:ParA family protein [Mucilaginibacter sp. L3T2-6]MDO3643515.1 ParA family protein [Mucilaginibacter sp. L3T2-6]MDV6215966.1 ParA family protein [Mucilaginibacter sp. L3T2-6]
MIIIIGNQKGGAGKSTLTLLLANYLTQAKSCPVTVIDMDYQQSIIQKFDKAKILENEEPYEVIPANLESYPALRNLLDRNAKDIILIDLPGKLDDDGLIPVFTSADLVICPFAYDEFSFESTVLFTVVLRKINPKMPMVFVPNRVKANARYEIMLEVNEQLSKFGKITAVLPDRVDFQRVNTFLTPLNLSPVIIPVFEQIYADHLYGKHEITGRSDSGATGETNR